jgi:hypothetical protein
MRAPEISPMERRGRIILAGAVLALFLTVTASMIAGRLLTPLVLAAVAIGAVGWIAMAMGKRRY